MTRIRFTAIVIVAVATMTVAPMARAESIGPLPYNGVADSPFDMSGLGTTFFLDDFSQPLHVFHRELPPYGIPFRFATLSTPGVEISGTVGWTGANIVTVGGCTNSIPASCFSGLSFEFDATELGFLPHAVGFAVSGFGTIGLSAYDAQGRLVASTTAEPYLGYFDDLPIPPPPSSFIGATYTGGISRIAVGSNEVMFELDDFQYGQLVPEPASALLVASALLFITARRRRPPQGRSRPFLAKR